LPKSKTGSLKVSPSLPGASKLKDGGKEMTVSDSADCEKVSFKPEKFDTPKPVVLK